MQDAAVGFQCGVVQESTLMLYQHRIERILKVKGFSPHVARLIAMPMVAHDVDLHRFPGGLPAMAARPHRRAAREAERSESAPLERAKPRRASEVWQAVGRQSTLL